jgi:hypothetical protein
MDPSTIDALQAKRARTNTDEMARDLCVSRTTVYDALNGRHRHVSQSTENWIRFCLGLDPLVCHTCRQPMPAVPPQ